MQALRAHLRSGVSLSKLHLNGYSKKFPIQVSSILCCHHDVKEIVPFQMQTIRKFNSDSDYGKYDTPGNLQNFYDWFADSSLIHAVEWYLTSMHDLTGMPWCLSIVVSTVLLRSLVTTPLFITQMKNSIKYQQFLPLFAQIQQKLWAEVNEERKKSGWDEKTAIYQYRVNLARHRMKIYKEHKVPGLLKRYVLPLVQIPLWVSMSVSLRHITDCLPILTPLTPALQAVNVQFSQEGCLWFANLCQADPYFIMPVLFGVANLAVIEIHRGDGKHELKGLEKILIYTVRTISVMMIPLACTMPSGVVLYWLSSSLYGAGQALLFSSSRVRKTFGLPLKSLTPYQDLLNRFKFKKSKT